MPVVDVAIIGFGPVGAVATCLLGEAGLSVTVIDSATEIYDKPRAVAIDHEIARLLQGLGLGEALQACSEPFTDSVYFGADGAVIKRLTMLPEPYPQGWTPSLVFLQPQLEQAVREAAGRHPSVTIRLGETMTALDPGPDHVTIETKGPRGTERLTARHVLGCDGASSLTRKLAGLKLADLGFDEPWLVVDVLANEAGLAKLPRTSVQYCEPARPTTYVICTGRHRRWEFSLNPGEDPQAMAQPDAVWRLLSRWITPDEGELWRSAAYRFHALVAEGWRKGRIFIAGDAAHQQPPFLGQGLCQGMRDVANLCWKLRLALHGKGGEPMLDSYGLERAGHVRGLTGTIKMIGGLIGQRDPERARARDAHLIAEAGGHVRPVPRQDLMPALAAGFLSAAPSAQAGRGMLFPQPWIERSGFRRRLDDVTGSGFRLIGPGGMEPALADALVPLGGVPVPLAHTASEAGYRECDGVAAGWLAAQGATHALVRPDHYVFGTARNDAEALALIEEAERQLTAA